MWNNFCAVVEDLFWFAFGSQSKNDSEVYTQKSLPHNSPAYELASGKMTPEILTPVLLDAPSTQALLLPMTATGVVTAHTTQALPSSVDSVPQPATTEHATAILHAPVVMYVSAHEGTACVHSPQFDFDAVIETLPYGTAVTVIGYQGRFASINRSNITGWVLKDTINPQKNEVWPQLVSGVTYDATHTDTIKTRVLISDMFGAGALNLPLQAGEYIAMRLKIEHRSILWSRKRPRTAGSWARLLRGSVGIHIGVTPKTDTVMEWQESDGEGRLGYVEAVAPDQTITISAVGSKEAGLFTNKTMSEEIWRELRPVFIEVA